MKDYLNKITLVFQDKILRNRILFTLFALILFRVLASIPVSGVDHARLAQFFASNQFFGLLNIFSGIVAALPTEIGQLLFAFDISQIPLYLAFAVVAAIVIIAVVIITEAERPIPVTYAKQVRGNKIYGGTSTYLPLRINQAGVI